MGQALAIQFWARGGAFSVTHFCIVIGHLAMRALCYPFVYYKSPCRHPLLQTICSNFAGIRSSNLFFCKQATTVQDLCVVKCATLMHHAMACYAYRLVSISFHILVPGLSSYQLPACSSTLR